MIYFFDNKGKTIDRYTMIFQHQDANGNIYYDAYTMSENAMSPQGVNMYSHTSDTLIEAEPEDDETYFNDLPKEVQRAVIARLQAEHDEDEISEEEQEKRDSQ